MRLYFTAVLVYLAVAIGFTLPGCGMFAPPAEPPPAPLPVEPIPTPDPGEETGVPGVLTGMTFDQVKALWPDVAPVDVPEVPLAPDAWRWGQRIVMFRGGLVVSAYVAEVEDVK